MKNTSTNGKKMQLNVFQYGVVAYITLASAIICSHSAARELRPSEHGLAHQRDASPPINQNGGAQDMLSFFGSTTPFVPLPEAQGIVGGDGDTWWNSGSRDRRRDHLRVGLLAVAAFCGFASVVLMVVAGVVFHLRRRREKAGAERLSSFSELHNDKRYALRIRPNHQGISSVLKKATNPINMEGVLPSLEV